MGIVVLGACLVLTVFYVLTADVAPAWKGLAVALYVASWFVDRLIPSGLPLGFIMQVLLCFFYLISFKLESL